MTARKRTTARGATETDKQAQLRRTQAYQRVFGEGAPTRDDKDIVLSDLLKATGFFRPPSYAEWMAKTKTPQGFELHCALQAARAEPMRHIMGFLNLSDDDMLALERAVREEAKR